MSETGNVSTSAGMAAQAVDSGRIREDLRATLGARKELGSAYEPELVDAFLRRLDQTVDERIEQQVRGRARRPHHTPPHGWSRGGLLLAAVALGIPLAAFSLCFGAFMGILFGIGFHSFIAGLVFAALVAGGSFAAIALVLTVLGLVYVDRRRAGSR